VKKQWAVLLLALSLTACAGCGATGASSAASGSAVSSSGAASSGAVSSGAASSGAAASSAASDSFAADCAVGDSYTLDRSVTVSGGKALTLRLHGTRLNDSEYGISTVDVLDGDKVIQTVSVKDGIDDQWGGSSDAGTTTESFSPDGDLTTADMNFDGAGDIGLTAWTTPGANIPAYYWLWDSDKQQFLYAFCLCNAKVDTTNQQIVCETRDGAAEHDTDYYTYDDSGKLQNVERVVETVDESGKTVTKTYVLDGGKLQEVK